MFIKASDYECISCPLGERSNDTVQRSGCTEIPETFLDYNSTWAISAMTFSCIGTKPK